MSAPGAGRSRTPDRRRFRIVKRRRVITDGPFTVTIRAIYLHVGHRAFSISFDSGRIPPSTDDASFQTPGGGAVDGEDDAPSPDQTIEEQS